jgi:hypothetical protein
MVRIGNSIWHAVADDDASTMCGVRFTAEQVRRRGDWHDLAERPQPLSYGEAGRCPFCLRATPCSDGSPDKEAS